LVDTGFGAFNQGSVDIDQTYVANSHIDTSNLPSTNDIDPADNSGTTKFRLSILKEAERYCSQWGNAFADGPLAPTGAVIVPSKAAADFLDEVVPSSAKVNKVAEDVLENYLEVSYAGRRWVVVPDVTIAPKRVYPVLNKPFGKRFTKPSLDGEYVEPESPAQRMSKNWEERFQTKVVGHAYAEPHRIRILRIRYQD